MMNIKGDDDFLITSLSAVCILHLSESYDMNYRHRLPHSLFAAEGPREENP